MDEIQLIIRMEENDAFIRKNYTKLQKLYPDEYIVVDNGKVIAHSKNAKSLSSTLKSNGVELTTVLVQFIPKRGVEIVFLNRRKFG